MSVTMKDIAEASGGSCSMVSHVLNGRAEVLRIALASKEKVLLATENLGYCSNQLARSVVTGRSRILAFWMSDMGLYAPVSLGSIHQDYKAMGELATKELLRQIERGERHPLNLKLATKLIIGASSSGGIDSENFGKDAKKG